MRKPRPYTIDMDALNHKLTELNGGGYVTIALLHYVFDLECEREAHREAERVAREICDPHGWDESHV